MTELSTNPPKQEAAPNAGRAALNPNVSGLFHLTSPLAEALERAGVSIP
jgi:hypothetical protein